MDGLIESDFREWHEKFEVLINNNNPC
jgi:hypothetical protein